MTIATTFTLLVMLDDFVYLIGSLRRKMLYLNNTKATS